MKFGYKKILIVGCGGAGKSTFAVKMGRLSGLPVIHLDKLWWLPDWETRPEKEFDELLKAELLKPEWIIDGNYFRTFRERLNHADFCVFLDYPTELCIQSVYKRAGEYRGKTRPDMTEGCEERVDAEFKDWILNFNGQVRPEMLSVLKNGTTPYAVFTDRRSAEEWLKTLD